MDIQTYLSLDATEMAKLIKERAVAPKELVAASYKQLEKVNPVLNAVVHHRQDKVLAEIERLNIERQPFSGVPLFLKDGQMLKGEPMTAGSKLLQHNRSNQQAHFVEKILTAGFLCMGHSTTPEFALKNITEAKLHGPTCNPWNPTYSPGGSSGGSAALIASGVVPVAGASDGGGSIRIPASFTGLFGLKPTRGRTPVGPGVGRQWQGAAIDFVLSRTVRDSAALLDLLQVVQPEAAFQALPYKGKYVEAMKADFNRPLKIGFTTKSPVQTHVSSDAKLAVEKTVKDLAAQGHIIEEADPRIDGIQLMKDYYLMNSGEMGAFINQLEKKIRRKITAEDVEVETWLLYVAGKTITAAEFSASLSSWDHAAEKMARFHDKYDFYITPTTAHPAPKIGELTHSRQVEEDLRAQIVSLDNEAQQRLIYDMFLPSLTYTPFTQLANLTGQPAMSMPVHMTKAGLPLGVQVIAPKGREHHLLQLAYQLEQTDLWQGMKGNPFFDK